MTLPLVYFLMTGSTQATYEDALTRFKAEVDKLLPKHFEDFLKKKKLSRKPRIQTKSLQNPSSAQPYYKDLLVDFELSQKKAFVSVFGGIPHGCYLHFAQCLEGRLLKFPKLNKRVKRDATNKTNQAFKSSQVLALITKATVNNTLEAFLSTSYMEKHKSIFRLFVE